MDAKQRIRFAIEFASMDLVKVFADADSRDQFKRGFSSFIYGTPGEGERLAERGGILAMASSPLDGFRQPEYLALKNDAIRLLTAFGHPLGIVRMPAAAEYGVIALPGINAHAPIVTGPIRDVFLIVLWHLLAGSMADHVGRCPEDYCRHRLFFRPTKRRVYCSSQCAVRASMREMRKRGVVKSVVKKVRNVRYGRVKIGKAK